MRIALQQIYINLFVEYGVLNPIPVEKTFQANSDSILVVKNPLSPVEHPGGVGVNNELFEESLEQFVVCFTRLSVYSRGLLISNQTRVLS